ncbi:MAG: ATP-grasp domain-containing protein [Rhodospirillales bacterium]|nr:ATP-grasp domain-containing protein [Rhodospirillales bacterium]
MKTEMDCWLVSVGAGRWQLSGIKAAQRQGIKVLALDGDASAQGIEFADKGLVVDISDVDAVIAAVKTCGVIPDGAVSFVNEAGMLAAAALRDTFSLPGTSFAITEKLINKAKQRAAWDDAGLSSPKWQLFGKNDASKLNATLCSQKMIVKPVDSAGSRGISVIGAGEDPTNAIDRALSSSRSKVAIVETFITGTEYTIETFGFGEEGHKVLAVTEKRKVPGSADTVAMELATPNLQEQDIAEIGILACKALEALGYCDGPGHTEVLRTIEGDLYLVESAGRGGGFMVTDGLVPKASGIDLSEMTALQAVGRNPKFTGLNPQAFVLRFLPSISGEVTSLNGFDVVNALSNVEAGPLVKIGQQVSQAQSDGDRLAYILSWDTSLRLALDSADHAEQLINVEVSKS